MAVSAYDKAFLTEGQQKSLAELTDQWNKANAAGDTAGAEAAHNAAETIRAGANYSGGADGGGYTKLDSSEGYNAAQLPSYTAQVDAVNDAYNAAQEVQLQSLKTAYDTNLATLEAAKAQIPEQYQTQRNNAAAESQKAKQSFNEYAAASGINSGAGSQAELSRSNTYQANVNSLNKAEAQAQTDAENEIAQLKVTYQNEVASAIAQGEYERAAALLEEYRTAEQSAVSVAQSQADENYKAYSAAYNASQTEAANTKEDAENKAANLAKYGDFSGYAALGYTQDEINTMTNIWRVSNPDLAYSMGYITADQYFQYTGTYPAGYETAVTYGSSGSSGGSSSKSSSSGTSAAGSGATNGSIAGIASGLSAALSGGTSSGASGISGGLSGSGNSGTSGSSGTSASLYNPSLITSYATNGGSSSTKSTNTAGVTSGIEQMASNGASSAAIKSAISNAYDNGLISWGTAYTLLQKYA